MRAHRYIPEQKCVILAATAQELAWLRTDHKEIIRQPELRELAQHYGFTRCWYYGGSAKRGLRTNTVYLRLHLIKE